jgi:hypothetical protein
MTMNHPAPLKAPRARASVLVALLLIDTRSAFAERAEAARPVAKTVTVQTDLITPLFSAYYLETNVRLSDHFGLLINGSYLLLDNDDWSTRTGTFGVGLSYYFEGESPRRWYVEAVGEANLSSWRHGPSGEVAPLGLGYTGVAVGGYRFIWDWGAVVDLAAGIVVLHLAGARVTTADGVVSSQALTNVYPAAKANIGWAF